VGGPPAYSGLTESPEDMMRKGDPITDSVARIMVPALAVAPGGWR
jgi:hypothetical protein